MPSLRQKLQFISEGGRVVRYHSRPGIKPDTDAHHSHGVAMLCAILSGESDTGHTKASPTLLMAALSHDLAEQTASDVSTPTKNLLDIRDQLHDLEAGVLRQYDLDYERWLTAEEEIILKLADTLDGAMYSLSEIALGNRNMLLVWRRWCEYIETISTKVDIDHDVRLRAAKVYQAMQEIFDETISTQGPQFDCFA